MSKIIFLDIDGVLNSVRSTVALGFEWPYTDEEKSLDPIAVGLLKSLCVKTDAKIVISSTWRQGRTKQDFLDIFAHYGWDDFPIIGVTPKMHTIRGTEIEYWLLNSREVEQYVILDDSDDMLASHMDNFVRVNLTNGLSLEDYVKALKILDPNHLDLSPMSLGGYVK
jgi:hypothetical protein